MGNKNVVLITSMEDFFSLKQDWENLLSANKDDNLYHSFDWYYAVSHLFIHPVNTPCIFCIKDDQKTIAILPCCIVKRRLRLFSFKSLEFIGNIYSAYRGGIILKGREQEAAKSVIRFLLANRVLWHMLHFEDIPESDPFLNALIQEIRQKKLIFRIEPKYAKLVIQRSPGKCSRDYWHLLSNNLRQQIRRSINKMNREGTVIIVPTLLPEHDIKAAMDHYYEIYRQSWKDPEMDSQFHRKLAEYLLSKRKLRLFTLYFRKEKNHPDNSMDIPISSYESTISPSQCIPKGYLPIATAFYAVNGNYACFLKTAYRQDYATYSAGTVLTWFVVKWLFDLDNVTIIDLQKEDDAYKFKWGRFEEMHVLFQVANPINPLSILEILGEKWIVPAIRELRKAVDRRATKCLNAVKSS